MPVRPLALALAAVITAGTALAQPANLLSVTVSPNPAPLGQTITITAEDASNTGLFTPFGCLVGAIYDAPNGNVVRLFPCTFLPGAIPPCGSGTPRMALWDQMGMGGGQVAPGTYWAQIQHSVGMFGATTTEWYCMTIEDPMAPVPALSAAAPAMIGQPYVMDISNAEPSALYVVALSQSTNMPPALSLGICLDFDPLFNLSLQGLPGVFVNFVGGTDAAGSAGGITINFPNSPILSCFTGHAQAGILGVAAPAFTNDLTFTVQ